ncbi:LPXTG cell wall anchor domain-containing protein, partial [Nocardioides sp. CFH 31398]|uniref:DUF7507 domain-containing protein n=1 Tax=Nocardioides sp. CFH 31398 TaxID=2919579 RepID=UPI001F0636D5
VVSDPDTVRVPVTAEADVLTLDKRAAEPVDVNGSGLVDAGDTIAYSFTLTNDGNVALDELVVTDPMLAGSTPAVGVTCEVTALAPGESTECAADGPYVVTEADERAGEVVNTATAEAVRPGGARSVSNEDSTRTTGLVVPDPGLRIDKTAGDPVDVNGSGLTDAGDTIAYSFRVTNTGNVPLSEVAVDDTLLGAGDPPVAVTCETPGDGVLAPGRSVECAAESPYVVTEADESAGSVDNTAAATGTDPDGGPVRSPDDSTSTPVQTPVTGLEIDKRAADPVDVNDSGLTDAGDTIAYTFTVTNTGTVPVTGVEVRDPLLASEEIDVTCAATSLDPGTSTRCRAATPYVVTTADELEGEVVNVARAAGSDPDGDEVLAEPDSTTTPVSLPAPALAVEKSADVADVNDSGLTDAGDEVAYTFTVTNTGDVPVRDVAIDDDLLSSQQPPISVTCADVTLAPGGSTDCTADAPYVVTAADEDAGVLRNTATATGVDPDETPVRSDPDSVAVPTAEGVAVLTLDKVAGDPVDVNSSGITDRGDTIDYTFTVTNDGDVPVTRVRVADSVLAAQGVTVTCTVGRLAPGEATTCDAAPYRVTAADERAGEVLNVATASALDPDRDAVESNEDTTRTPVVAPRRVLGLTKTAGDPVDVNGSGLVDAGDTVAYTFEVTNNGNVPVTVLRIDDPLLASQDPPITVTCSPVRLVPGEVSQCVADAPYVVTEADEQAGEVVNTARATAVDADGEPVVSRPDSTRTEVTSPEPELELTKRAAEPVDANDSGLTDAGDTIAYTFTVTNTGNVPVTDVRIDDPLLAGQDPPITVTCEATRLDVGRSTDCAADAPYVLTRADERAGEVENTATAVGTDPDGDDVTSDEASTTTPVVEPRASLALDKRVGSVTDVDGDGLTDAGDEIRWRFVVTNTGTVPVSSVAIDDPLLEGTTVTCDRTRLLAPGDGVPTERTRTVCLPVEPYVITEADEAAGEVVNTATADGVDPDRLPVVSDESSTRTPVQAPSPALGLTKSSLPVVDRDGDGRVGEGDAVTFTFRVTNTGDVPLSDVTVDDPLLAAQDPPVGVTCDATELAVGASTTCVADAPYVITADDEEAGRVVNRATASATDPDGDTAGSGPATETVPTGGPVPPVLGLVKAVESVTDVDEDGLTDAGDEIVYRFTVTNSSPTLTLDDVAVVDPLLGDTVTCADTTLPPAAADGTPSSTVCTSAPYVVTEADEAAGEVVNTATATATDPDGAELESQPDSTTTPLAAEDVAIDLDKRAGDVVDANGNGRKDAGDTVGYTFLVTNTGNVTLGDVTVADDLLDAAGIAVTCPDGPLAPGRSRTCEADAPYTVTEEDVRRGFTVNTATATGQGPDGVVEASDEDTVRVPLDSTLGPEAELTLDKRPLRVVDVDGDGRAGAGDTVDYEFVVTNTGEVTVRDLVVVDPLIDDVTCPVTTLRPDRSTTCTGTYTLSEDDAERGRVRNVARAEGTDPDGEPVVSTPDAVVLDLVDADPVPPGDPGDPGEPGEPGDPGYPGYPPPTDPGDSDDGGLLPDTGGPAAWVALIGLLLLGGGIGALLWSRRRRGAGRAGRHARETEART